eukprot:756957-Hanusia_phi.AAC.2
MVVQLDHKYARHEITAASKEDAMRDEDISTFDDGLISASNTRMVGVSRRWKVRNQGAWEPSPKISTETFDDEYFRKVREENHRALDRLRGRHSQHQEEVYRRLLRNDVGTTEMDRIAITLGLVPKLRFSMQHPMPSGQDSALRPHSWVNDQRAGEEKRDGGDARMRHSDGLRGVRTVGDLDLREEEEDWTKRDYGLFSGRIGSVRSSIAQSMAAHAQCAGRESSKTHRSIPSAAAAAAAAPLPQVAPAVSHARKEM